MFGLSVEHQTAFKFPLPFTAAILAAGRLIPDQIGTLALWPFLSGLISPHLLRCLGYARALAKDPKS